MPFTLTLDRTKKAALYQQIIEQVKNLINQGHLPVGARLPTVRHLAKELKVTRLTVHNAYSELQAQGWIEAIVGRGTYVAKTVQPAPRLASVERRISPETVIGDVDPIRQMPGMRLMASAFPDESLMPVNEFWQSLNRLQSEATTLMQYSSPQGDPHLRVELTSLLQERQVTATPDDLIITAGATQGLALVAQALANRGDRVLMELPGYHGFINTLTAQGIQPIGAPRDQTGLRLDVLERIIVQQRPRFFYLVPNFHNPTGWVLPFSQRQQLLDMAEHYGVMLVEDDVYGRLSYREAPPPALKAMDRSDIVIYLSSFSKDLMPGLRVGYMAAPPPMKDRLPALRGAADMFGTQLVQRAVANLLERKKFKPHLRRVLPIYKRRRDMLLRTLTEWMPDYISWTEPEGGFTCWLTLPDDSRLDDLYQASLENGLAYSPGSVFMTEPDGQRHIRLCFGNLPEETIREAVILLSNLIRERIGTRVRTRPPAFNQVPLV